MFNFLQKLFDFVLRNATQNGGGVFLWDTSVLSMFISATHIKFIIVIKCVNVAVCRIVVSSLYESKLVFDRTIYQKIREYDILDKRKTVTALKAGEDRAILLGLSMIILSVMMYFVLGITMVRSYSDRYARAPHPTTGVKTLICAIS